MRGGKRTSCISNSVKIIIALHLNSRFSLPFFFFVKRGWNLLGILPTLRPTFIRKCLCCYDNIACFFKAATIFPSQSWCFCTEYIFSFTLMWLLVSRGGHTCVRDLDCCRWPSTFMFAHNLLSLMLQAECQPGRRCLDRIQQLVWWLTIGALSARRIQRRRITGKEKAFSSWWRTSYYCGKLPQSVKRGKLGLP